MLVLLAGQFLTIARDAETAGIYYGAWEARDAEGNTPIVDLSSFVQLMNWTQAAAHFDLSGNATALLKQVKRVNDPGLHQTYESLRAVSSGLRLGLAVQIGQSVAQLLATLEQEPPAGEPAASPMRALFQQIAAKYAPLSLEEPLAPDTVPYHLRQQAALISWYMSNELAMQAILLAREWLITWMAWKQGQSELLDWPTRESISSQLAGAMATQDTVGTTAELPSIAGLEQVLQLWRDCHQARNQLAHMSFRPENLRLEHREIIHLLRKIERGINQLATILPRPPQEALKDWNPWAELM